MRRSSAATVCFAGLLCCSCTDSTGRVAPTLTAAVAPAATSVPANDSVELTFMFRDADENIIGAAPVSLSTTLTGLTFTPSSGTTLESGEFTTTVHAAVPGNAPITASVGGMSAVVLPAFSVCAPAALNVPGNAAGSMSPGQCFASERANALFSFTTASTGAVALTASSVFAQTLAVTTSVPQEHIVVTASQGTAFEWLLPTGSYQVRLGASAGAGAFAISAASVSGNSGCVQRYLATAVTVIGQSIAPSDCDFGDGTKYDSFGIYSSRGCTIRLQSSEFTPWVWLYDETTSLLDGRTELDPGHGAVLQLVACKYLGGPVFIWANTGEGETGGAYTLVVTLDGPAGVMQRVDTLHHAASTGPALGAAISRTEIRAARQRVITDAMREKQ